MRRCTFALQHDRLDRAPRRGKIGDPEEARQSEFLGADLSVAVTDEQSLFAELIRKAREALQHAVIQVALTGVILR